MSLSCDLCAGTAFSELERYSDGVCALRCRQCGLICLYPLPEQKSLSEHYDAEYYRPWLKEQSEARARLWRRRMALIEKSGPARLLDVGCGDGAFIKMARSAGWDVRGTELSGWAAGHVAEAGIEVRRGDLLSVDFGQERFDVVTMWHVLEHTHSPRSNMERVFSLLRPGGMFVGALPNASNRLLRAMYPLARGRLLRYYEPGEREVHLYHFTESVLRAMLEKCGFEVLRTGLDRSALSLHYRALEICAGVWLGLSGLNWGEGIEFAAWKK